ncbi:bifunctional 2-polyprenyl-6-hydroxyphenol methylase/3-demethylubiquinol 3-O-methyltransferase UbiG [Kribbella sp. VKM Ac-2568]|uniref:bifunctional 2-polyprenyl-6-hydroxyphenol methylase/3-demethylubiquinol 3-O-methyltransferase UbiG n=1 Tax=Kribbella sp. VKM Ac-2568 TaxID=2512219 RepID=UPI0010474283|nr:bifunctional 2-polyprenyl-6-hydroxyphenol methylase/3-demethylubiquinol 3-O-methyltransferase UbiG [Kribbella sp. VKM Ac-2568]TCM42703.1 3-demethylubiquinone-9 3-methyltransferase [Kribbella sp. VKM Ac-2568]
MTIDNHIDNEIYDRLGGTWWDEDNPLNVLHGSFTPGRLAYFREVLERTGRDPAGLRALDVGCGGGFLAEEFARLGCQVVGVDPSRVSIATARRHATSSDLKIEYVVASGEHLPLESAFFDLAYCCDVLEHVADVELVIRESARVLKPGGLYLFDTINHTAASQIFAISLLQKWRLTRVIDTDLHNWDMFITPSELGAHLRRHRLSLDEIVGLGPRASMARLLRYYVQQRLGRITFGELSRRMNVGQVDRTDISYMGYATKANATDTDGGTATATDTTSAPPAPS